ncbi:ComEA family DNA-binding protein [Salinactinospora qingdaonensis]
MSLKRRLGSTDSAGVALRRLQTLTPSTSPAAAEHAAGGAAETDEATAGTAVAPSPSVPAQRSPGRHEGYDRLPPSGGTVADASPTTELHQRGENPATTALGNHRAEHAGDRGGYPDGEPTAIPAPPYALDPPEGAPPAPEPPAPDANTPTSGREGARGRQDRAEGMEAPPPGYTQVTAEGSHRGRRELLTRFFPERVESPRLGVAGVRTLAAVCVVAVALTCWFMVRDRAEPQAAPVRGADASPSASVSAAVDAPTLPESPAPSTTATATSVVVHVGGKVAEPGLVTLPAGARVADAIEAAGGVLPDAETGLLNLARPVIDGEQVLVGLPSPSLGPRQGREGRRRGPLDLNVATLHQLDELPGVGPVLAGRILDFRAANGGFASVEQLRDVDGIGERRYAELSELVVVGGSR